MSSLARNTALLTSSSVLQKVVAFVYFALIARTVGVADIGVYFIALTLVTTVGVIDDLGLNSVLIRDIARDRSNASAILKKVLSIKLLMVPVAAAVAFFLPVLLGYGENSTLLIRLAIPVMLADTFALTFYGVLRGLQELKYEAIGIFIGQLLSTIIGVVVLFFLGAELPILIFALLIGSTWNAIFSGYQVLKRLGSSAFIPSTNSMMPILRTAFPFFLAAVFVKIYSSVDSFTLKAVLGDSAVGLYSVAYKLTYAFQFLPLAFIGALYPKMSSLSNNPTDLKKTFLGAEWYLALLVSPIVFGISALAPEIIPFMYGEDYLGSIMPLTILIFVLIPIFLDFPIGSYLNATGRQMTKTAIMGVTMVVNIIANLILIPRVGIVGASIAGLLSFVVMFALGVVFTQKQLQVSLKEWFDTAGKFIIAGLVMFGVVFTGKPMMPSWIMMVPIGAVVYTLVSICLGAINRSHWNHIKTIIKKPSYGTDPSTNA